MNIIVGCIVKKDDKFLMVKEGTGTSQGKWNFPVGHLEEDETILEGAKRETLEETGYLVDINQMFPITEVYKNNKKYILIRFLATPKEKINTIAEDIIDVKWMNTQEILNIPEENFRGYDSNRKILEQLKDQNLYSLDIIKVISE